MSRQLLPAVSFVNLKITGRGKESLGRIRLEIEVWIANFWSFGLFEVSFAGQFACELMVTMS